MKNILIFMVFFCSLASGQPWLNQGGTQMPSLEAPFDSSQIIADRITASKIPVLIDFWAPWCGPCRMLGPVIEELKKKYAGKVSFEKINVDVERQISAYFRISSIPAVFIVNDKTVINYLQGFQPKAVYDEALQAVLKPSATPAPAKAR